MRAIKNKINITADQANQRLDIFLSQELSISRSQAQKMIDTKQVLVNKELPKKAGDKVKVGQIITIHSKPNTTNPVKQNRKTKKPELPDLTSQVEIIADTPDYIVINKPTGMLTHPTMAKEKNTLANFITKKYPGVKKIGDDPARPGIVHRLDKEASGLIVVAKTQAMFDRLKEQFKNRTVDKEYLALVHGQVARDWGEINFRISRSKNSDRMAALPSSETEKGKEAKTEFVIEKKFVNFTLLRVKIHTGRMHQIRVHLLAYDHPLVGDPLYTQKKQKKTWDIKLGRLFLHSTKLGFINAQGTKLLFELPLPKQLAEFLKLLR